ncbi:MAG TPA: NADH-quinone oxidoreductase subunit C [Rhizomicrobium sp.]|jgi:NADH-quinone oxidoreductase subunit C
MTDLNQLGETIANALPGAVTAHTVAFNELTLEVEPSEIVRVIGYLRDEPDCAFKQLIDLCGVDWPQRPKRFDVVYHLMSLTKNMRVRVKAQLAENETIPSIVSLHPSANWFEREAFDMYGFAFDGHPDMRRILTDYGFSGFPLRKDFPLTGYVEVRYDDELKRVVYQPVQLVQEFRDFDFMSPWEGAKYVIPGDEKASKS